MDLTSPISEAGRAFKMYAKRLDRLGIKTLEDLLFYVPFRYDDTSLVSKIVDVQEGEDVTIKGIVIDKTRFRTRRGFSLQKVVVEDETGKIECTWFNQNYILTLLKVGDTLSAFGRVGKAGNKTTLLVKQFEVIESEFSSTTHTGRLVPVYHETHGVSSKWIRNRITALLADPALQIKEYLPEEIKKRNNLIDLADALRAVHFPASLEDAEKAYERLSFDELLITQAAVVARKKVWKRHLAVHVLDADKTEHKLEDFYKSLPFKLTNAQKKAVKEILSDMQRKIPMNRMLEGDVGSGKTVVATAAIYSAFLNGFQSAFMAPTEILATQHYNTVSKLLEPLGVKVAFFTSSKKTHKDGNFDVAIGTHALIHKSVVFKNLALVVVDEQHRFGVEQRAVLRDKGKSPHFLSMTATPIPRTVFLTVYGDLDLSMLSEMPLGRKRIKTFLVPEEKREKGYEWIKNKLKTDEQMFVVCPFIEPSETMTTIKAATEEFKKLKENIFPKFTIELLHGKLKSAEKDRIIEDFRKGKIQILVTTPVVEVGMDIPKATIMLIEAAERFGLASLHQLRGRVGRNDMESFCFLFTESKTPKVVERLKNMEKIYSGAELAEIDLKLRGPGDMFGTMQHGVPELKIAKFSDFDLLKRSKDEAEKLYEEIDLYPVLKEKLKLSIITKVTPD